MVALEYHDKATEYYELLLFVVGHDPHLFPTKRTAGSICGSPGWTPRTLAARMGAPPGGRRKAPSPEVYLAARNARSILIFLVRLRRV
jgi:hypothetical protein